MPRTYWQVSGATSDRNFSEYFLNHGIAFVGGDQYIAALKEVAAGDIMILKQGRMRIRAVGEVVRRGETHGGEGDKHWLRDFDGWDLPAYCYVDWRVPNEAVEATGLTRAAIQRTWLESHRSIADQILLDLPVRELRPEPDATNPVSDDETLRFLVGRGLRPAAAEDLTNTVRRIRLLAEYYNQQKTGSIREHETRTFLVAPLLLALGWAEQQIKIELPCTRGRVDMACFSKPYGHQNAQCVVVIETKDLKSGLDLAIPQARAYSADFPACQVLVVSNGWCYKTFLRDQESGLFSKEPSAYLNLLMPRDRYPLDPVNTEGALGVLKWLLP